MAKEPIKYYEIDPWKIIEKGFNKERGMASESIFCLGNEYMGVRGFFEETYNGSSLIGTYFNGIYEVPKKEETGGYLGISHKSHFMINSLNYLNTRIWINNEEIDLNKIVVENFERTLDLRSGELVRKFTYQGITFSFYRLLEMTNYHEAHQKIVINSECEAHIKIQTGLNYDVVQWGKVHFWKIKKIKQDEMGITVIGKTKKTKQRVISNYQLLFDHKIINDAYLEEEVKNKKIHQEISINVLPNETHTIEKIITNYKEKNPIVNDNELISIINKLIDNRHDYNKGLIANKEYYKKVWDQYDIKINGDMENQQGIRYCIFTMIGTYQGIDPNSNIGAKGLTGEAYSGNAFWDTEAYCLPFFLFTNSKAAKDLLMFRYHTLPNAMERAKELDCVGACYPIATLNGNEACNLWQHASLQLQPTTAVCYGIWHYTNVTKDKSFVYQYGIDILIEASRFLVSRGDWNSNHTYFGFYGVMGPDEFQMMVNHNTYTNYMGKRSIEYTIEVLKDLKENHQEIYEDKINKHNLTIDEINYMETVANHMHILYDDKTKLFEQHAGYFDLPHIDIKQIPTSEFPLYAHWSYDHLYRNDMIKQPDVLMMMFLYNQSFSKEQKEENYDFYEPRTIHESSLSPSIHSVLALELGKLSEGLSFFGYATRMDLDDYNRNTCEGIHITSIAAAWVNIIYGFGGVRSDGDCLKISPVIPNIWSSYEFKITYLGNILKIVVNKNNIEIENQGLDRIPLLVYDQHLILDGNRKLVINHE